MAFNALGPQPDLVRADAGTDVRRLPGPAAAGVPVARAGWAGNCTFNNPGTYSFYCVASTAR